MTKEGGFCGIRKFHFYPKIPGLGGNSKLLSTVQTPISLYLILKTQY